MRRPRAVFLMAGALALAGALTAGVLLLRSGDEPGDFRGSRPPPGFELPDFTLPDFEGVSVSTRELRGSVVLVTFLDSQCTEACPIIASQVARTVDHLTPEERGEIVPLAISTDPEEDTPAAVRSFLEKNRAVGRLRYLVAPAERLRPVWEDFQILASLDTGIDTLHSAPVRIYDREGTWVSTLHAGADLTTDNLVHDLRVALGS